MRKLTLITLVVFGFSCSDDQQLPQSEQDGLKSVGIKSVELVDKNDARYTQFLNSPFYQQLAKKWKVLEDKAEVVSLNSTDRYQLVGLKSRGDVLVAVYDVGNQEFVQSFVHRVEKSGELDVVTQYKVDGNKLLSYSVREGKVMDYRRFSDLNAKTQLGGSFDNCMDIAVNACAADWQCAILCGLAFWQCAAATAIACYYTK